MDGHAVAAGDKADDRVAGDGGAALGELDQAVAQTFHDNARIGVLIRALGRGLQGGDGVVAAGEDGIFLGSGSLGGGLLSLQTTQAEHLVPDAGDALVGGGAAVADGGVHLVQGAEAYLVQDMGKGLVGHDVLHLDAGVTQLGLELGAAGGDVLLPLLLLEPLADLVSGLVGLTDVQPVAAGTLGRLGGDDLHDVAVVQGGVVLHHAAVDLGTHHAVAHGGVDGVGEVDGGGARGQVDDIAVGGEDEDLVAKHIHLQGADKFLGVGVLLAFQQLADPLEVALGTQILVGHALLILPVGGHAVFSGLMHLPGADLHLKGDALPADDGGVQRLVHIGLGGADIVLKTAQHGLEHIVHTAQHIVALGDVVHDDPEGVQIEDLVQGLVLGVHLAVNGIRVLDAAVHLTVDAIVVHALLDAGLDGSQKFLVGGGTVGQGLLDLLVAHGVEVAQRQVFQLPLQLLHTEAVGDGGVDLHGFQTLFPLLHGGLVFHRPHIVQTVANLDEDDPDVIGHGHEHLTQILHLLLFLGDELDLGQLGHALHQVGHRQTKALGHIGVGGAGVLDGVVEQGGDDRVHIQTQVSHDLGHGQGVDDIRLAAFAELTVVLRIGKGKGVKQPLGVQIGGIGAYFCFQCLIAFQDRIHIITSFIKVQLPTESVTKRGRPRPALAGGA